MSDLLLFFDKPPKPAVAAAHNVTYVQDTTATGVTNVSTGVLAATLASVPAAGNCLVLYFLIATTGVTISSITGGGVTWAQASTVNGSNFTLLTWVGLNASGSGGTTITVTTPAGLTQAAMSVAEFHGTVAASATDVQATNSGTSAAPATGSVTTTVADLVIAAAGWNSTATVTTQPSGYTALTVAANAGGGLTLQPDWRYQNSAGANSATWAISASAGWASSILSLKAA